MPGKPTVYDLPPPRHVTIILFDEISEVAVHPPGSASQADRSTTG